MTDSPTPESCDRNDGQLRQRMREALKNPDVAPLDMAAFERRVVAQWSTWVATDSSVAFGPAGIARLVLRSRGIQWSFVALAMVLVLGYQSLRHTAEPSFEDLLEPDVLSLVALCGL